MLPNYIPMSLFLSAAVIAAWAGGKSSGFTATAIGGLAEVFFFSSSPFVFLHSGLALTRLLIYLVQGGFISYLLGDFSLAQKQILENEKIFRSHLNAPSWRKDWPKLQFES